MNISLFSLSSYYYNSIWKKIFEHCKIFYFINYVHKFFVLSNFVAVDNFLWLIYTKVCYQLQIFLHNQWLQNLTMQFFSDIVQGESCTMSYH